MIIESEKLLLNSWWFWENCTSIYMYMLLEEKNSIANKPKKFSCCISIFDRENFFFVF